MDIKEWLKEYCNRHNYDTDDETLKEVLTEAQVIHKEFIDSHRWFDSWKYVVKIEDKFIEYPWNIHTGDDNPYNDSFDWDEVYEVVPYDTVITNYRVKTNNENTIFKERITIPREEYEELLHKEMWLQALETAGVDNWLGCGDANEIMKKWLEELNN